MILRKIEYHESEGTPEAWAMRDLTLEKINLLVGKNATGKTLTIRVIDSLSANIMDRDFNEWANYNVEFSNESEKYYYIFNNDHEKVVFEKFIENDITRLQRNATGEGEMYTAEKNENINFQVPENKLAISRRDKLQYPYLEKIHEWANSVRYYSFGTPMKQDEYGKIFDNKDANHYSRSDNSVEIFYAGQNKFNNGFKETVLSSMNSIGYDLTDIDIQPWSYSLRKSHPRNYKLFAVEKDRDAIVNQINMSQGMFRALSIIIHVKYHVMMKIPATILIDDIGEGLDYERSTKLIKLLIELAEKSDNIQLIMSTNDRYVMNNVPLKYWQLIQRKGGECQVFNYRNSKEKFEEFKYMGLNNFDFLSTDYINSEWNKA